MLLQSPAMGPPSTSHAASRPAASDDERQTDVTREFQFSTDTGIRLAHRQLRRKFRLAAGGWRPVLIADAPGVVHSSLAKYGRVWLGFYGNSFLSLTTNLEY